MGQESSQLIENEPHNAPVFTEAQISLDEGSVLRPNGFFPPEIIVTILQYADLIDCIRCSQSCKLWYESIREIYQGMYIRKYGGLKSFEGNWKANFFRRTLADQNLKKGWWWADALTSFHANLSYIVSYEGNKVIFNNHLILVSSYADSKYLSAAYLVDLDTMKREPCDYGTIFANGFKITTLMLDNYSYFDWRMYEINDGSTKRIVKRKNEVPPPRENYGWYNRVYYKVFVNLDPSSPTVMTSNSSQETENTEHYLEVVDLRTGEIIAEVQLVATRIKGLIGEEIIADFDDGDLNFVNIFTNEHRTVPNVNSNYNVHYCPESHRIGFVNRSSEIVIHEWPSLNMVSRIDICAKFDISQNARPNIKSFAFDKSKLVVAILRDKSSFYAVFDIHTGELMQTFYNPSDGHDRVPTGPFGTIHLAPNGKIVTDYANLTVYDFASPTIYQKIPVLFLEANIVDGDNRMADQVLKSYVPATDLVDFVIKTLDAPIEEIIHRTLYKDEKGGERYRITGIGTYCRDREEFEKTNTRLIWSQLVDYLEPWEFRSEIVNTFQLTKANVTKPNICYHGGLVWQHLREVIFVYERFNKEKLAWEFTEPIVPEELAEKTNE